MKLELTTSDHVRRALAKRLGCPLDADVWARLDDEGLVGYTLERAAIDPEIALLDLLADYQDRAGVKLERVSSPEDRRAEALARILAGEARRLEWVREFREHVLGGQLLVSKEVSTWVARAARADGPPTRLVTVPEDDRRAGPLRWEVRTLAYPDEAGVSQVVPIAIGGTLGRLKELAKRLGALYGWWESGAVTFLLTDAVPVLPMAEVGARAHLRHAPLGTITLIVSARMRPGEVARLYSAERRSLIGHGRDRAFEDEWRADLAVFIADHNDGRTWRAAMGAWNEARPEHTFDDWRVFQRACRRSYDRITGRPLDWLGGRRAREEEERA